MKTLLMISAATLIGAGAAAAQESSTFITLDSNANGAVSYDEAVLADPTLTREAFADSDIDGDGSLNVAEFEAWLETRADAEAGVEPAPQDGSELDSDALESEIDPDAGIDSDIGTSQDSVYDDLSDPLEEPSEEPSDEPMPEPELDSGLDAEIQTEIDDPENPMRG